MNRAAVANTIHLAIFAALAQFRQRQIETPYAFALIGDPFGSYLNYAVATKQGLRRTASRYYDLGYRCEGRAEEEFDTHKTLAAWLRWANPDDGWIYGEFSEVFEVQAALAQLRGSGEFGQDGEGFEEFCTDVLASLCALPDWKEIADSIGEGSMTVGFTYGEDPDDYLRTATRANPYPLVVRLWIESRRAYEIDRKIRHPSMGR